MIHLLKEFFRINITINVEEEEEGRGGHLGGGGGVIYLDRCDASELSKVQLPLPPLLLPSTARDGEERALASLGDKMDGSSSDWQ